jgi:hypothetical protein
MRDGSGTNMSEMPIGKRQAADMLHVAPTAVQAAKRLQREAAPEVVEAVRRGCRRIGRAPAALSSSLAAFCAMAYAGSSCNR